jgi:hypothetical protein
MAENFTEEIYDCNELTVICTVPLYWNDLEAWGDEELMLETTTVRGIFTKDYYEAQVGRTGQDSANPQVRIPTAEIPNAAEGDSITVDGTAYTVGTPKPDGRGVTICDLYIA